MTLIGLSIFTVSEFMAALSPTFTIFLVARFIQGLGYACIFPTIFAYISELFPEEKRGSAIGVFASVSTLGAASGGIIAGFLIDSFGWPSIYWVSGILAFVGFIIISLVVPKTSTGKRQSLDYFGGFSLLLTVGSIISLPMMVANFGWSSSITITFIIGAVAGFILLLLSERQAAQPVLDFSVLKLRGVNLPIILAILSMFCSISLIYSLSFFVAGRPGWGATEVGLVTTFNYTMGAISAPLIGRLIDKHKPQKYVVLSYVVFLIGIILFSMINMSSPFWYIVIVVSLASFSSGASNTALMKIVLSTIPREKVGVGTGHFSMFRDLAIPLGSTFGLALFSTQKNKHLEGALIDRAQEAGINNELIPDIVTAGQTQQISPELANQLQTLGIQFQDLFNGANLDSTALGLNSVGYFLIGVVTVLVLISLILLKKNSKSETLMVENLEESVLIKN